MFRIAASCLWWVLAVACGDGTPTTSASIPDWEQAFDPTGHGWLLSVWGPAGDDLYAVGGTPERGAALHFDGTDWLPMSLPTGTPGLNWVFGLDSTEVYAVGNGGTLLHHDGSKWTTIPTGLDRDLWGIWGASSQAMWLVGGDGRAEGQATLAFFDGSTVDQVSLPDFMRARVFALFKVWGTSADNVYAVGQRGAVLHYDGSEWEELLVGADDDLIALWGTGPDRIVMVGGRSAARVVLWDGSDFRAESLAPLPGLNGIWMASDTTAHVAGVDNTLASIDLETFEYVEEYESPIRNDYHALFGDSAGRLTAVGGNLRMPSGPYRGAALTRPVQEHE